VVVMLRRRGGARRSDTYVATVYCDGHALDLAALRQWVDDGRPRSVEDSVAAITAGECPACRPRYLAGDAPEVERDEDGMLACGCCGTGWDVEGGGWVAVVDNGLAVVDEIEPIPVGASIDSAWFRVSPVDPVEGPTDVLRTELSAFARTAAAGTLDDEMLEDLIEGLALAYGGKAREDAEIYRVLSESGLDDDTADRWRAHALVTLHDIRKLFGGSA
jgi:hypothetical protein